MRYFYPAVSKLTDSAFGRASYFRGISRGQVYGLSARGLAIDVAGPKGEEFPSLLLSKALFFWLLPVSAGLILSIPLSWLEPAEAQALLRHPDCLTRLPRIGVTAGDRSNFPNADRSPLERSDLSAGAVDSRPGCKSHTGRLPRDTWDTYSQQIL